MGRFFLSSFFLLSLSLAAAEAVEIPCNQCDFAFEHEHEEAWIKKYASFDISREKINYVTSQSFVLFRITDSVLEINFHDLYLREGDFKSLFWNDWVGTRYTPLQLYLTKQRFLRIFHTLVETEISIDTSWTMEFAMGNWQVFDSNIGSWGQTPVKKFKKMYPAIDKIAFNLYPKNTNLSYERKLSPRDNFHPLVVGGIKPAVEINDIISEMKEFGIEVEFNEI